MSYTKYVIVWTNNNFPTSVVMISDNWVEIEGQKFPYYRLTNFKKPDYSKWMSHLKVTRVYYNTQGSYFIMYNNQMVSNNEKLGVLYKAGF